MSEQINPLISNSEKLMEKLLSYQDTLEKALKMIDAKVNEDTE